MKDTEVEKLMLAQKTGHEALAIVAMTGQEESVLYMDSTSITHNIC
jgi:hypothetical protein